MTDALSGPAGTLETQGSIAPPITHEDLDRARDRERVRQARAARGLFSRGRLLWLLVGPGILVILAENDRPRMVSYPPTAPPFGTGLLPPLPLLSLPLALLLT